MDTAWNQPFFTCNGLPNISATLVCGTAMIDGKAYPCNATLHTDGYFYQTVTNGIPANTAVGFIIDFFAQ